MFEHLHTSPECGPDRGPAPSRGPAGPRAATDPVKATEWGIHEHDRFLRLGLPPSLAREAMLADAR